MRAPTLTLRLAVDRDYLSYLAMRVTLEEIAELCKDSWDPAAYEAAKLAAGALEYDRRAVERDDGS